ncbi:BA14K family protein [Ahrensia kielensis]|uniref:Lectin-like protein BA14k n=1 Tax=Ahrensia kielensis TaxID=76980 RepID=A0ABU9T1U7_9HYPH
MNISKFLAAAAISIAASCGVSTSASAAPIAIAPIASPADGLVQKVGSERRRGFYRHRGHAFYNGHRGYRHHRRGYRRHNGYYFPHGAFSVTIHVAPRRHVEPRRVIRRAPARARIVNVGTLHVNWCQSKYRSYRASDNTFQPYHGGRKRCRSPYAR